MAKAKARKTARKSGPKGGRPRKELTDEHIRQIGVLAAVLNQTQIADALGLDSKTLRERMQENPRARSAYEKGRANAIRSAATSLLSMGLKGNVTALIFYLKTQAGWKETQVYEVGDLANASDETLEALKAGRMPRT
jgi:hypothetical protein